jgi:hypothetical protein
VEPIERSLEDAQLSMNRRMSFSLGEASIVRPRSLRTVTLDDGRTEFEWLAEDSETVHVSDGGNALRALLRLWDAQDEPERIRRFIEEYGVLGICRHFSWRDEIPPFTCSACRAEGALRREPVHLYCEKAAYFRGILLSLPHVLWGELPPDFVALVPGMKPHVPTYTEALYWVVMSLQWLAIQAFQARAVSPFFSAKREDGRILLDVAVSPIGLYASLILQLVSVMSSARGIHECSTCHVPYWTDESSDARVPWANGKRRNFCSRTCRDRARAADARARYHRLKRSNPKLD